MRKFLTIIAVLFVTAAFAQQKTVTGKVTKKIDNAPIANATVAVKGGPGATQTNAEGAFTINVPNDMSTLVLSSVGFETTEMSTEGVTSVNFSVNQLPLELNQVVVVGYTSQRKKDLTGAVAVVDLAPVKNNSSGNTMQALQGRVAGLYIEKDGSPNGSNGRILIRGANTLGNNNPLYVIDGIPTVRPEVFQNMDPATIASVQVLKDASGIYLWRACIQWGYYRYHKKWRQYRRQSCLSIKQQYFFPIRKINAAQNAEFSGQGQSIVAGIRK